MATDVPKWVDPGNGPGTNYVDIILFEVGEQRDLIALDEVAIPECRATGGLPDLSDDCTFNGYNTDATRKVIMRTTGVNRHNGRWDTSKYRIIASGNFQYVLNIGIRDMDVFGIQGSVDGGSGAITHGIACGASGTCSYDFGYNIVKATGGGRGSALHYGSGGTITGSAWNNTFYDFIHDSGGAGITVSDAQATVNLYQNTVRNCFRGIKRTFGTVYAKNNLVKCWGVNVNFADYAGTFDGTSTDNCASDLTAPGLNPHNSRTYTFANEAGEDYRLGENDTGAMGQGANLFADPRLPIPDDIEGDPRTVPYDCGSDQFTAGPMPVNGACLCLAMAGAGT
jgi:hypothetical protein